MRKLRLFFCVAVLTTPAAAQEWSSRVLEDRRTVYLDISSSPTKGSADAPIILIEFADYHCPACAHFVRTTLPVLDSNYISPGWVKLVFQDYPILSLHPGAMEPALSAHCAGDQGRYWEMHDFLFANPLTAQRDQIAARALEIGLDSTAFRACVKTKRHINLVRRASREGQSIGVRGTPTFFVAVAEPGATKVRVVRYLYGSLPSEEFRRVLDDVLLTLMGRK